MRSSNRKFSVAKNSKDLGEHLRLNNCETALMEHKAILSQMAVKAIHKSRLTVNEIVKHSGVARSKVSAIKNGSVSGISCELLIKVISSTRAKLTFKMAI